MNTYSTVPVADPMFATILADRLHDLRQDEDAKPHAHAGTKIRHSDAAKCARALGYTVRGDTPTDPMDLTGAWNVWIGQLVHDAFQQEAQRLWPQAQAELKVRVDDLSSGHVDLTTSGEPVDGRVSVEAKTVGGYGFKKAIGFKGGRGFDGVAEGPKWSWLVQGAVNAYCDEADLLVIVALSKEAVSVQGAERNHMPDHLRVAAEWRYGPETFRPIAEDEIARWQQIVDVVEDGELPPRAIPEPEGPVFIDNPTEGWYVDEKGKSRKHWACLYCQQQSRCIEDWKRGV